MERLCLDAQPLSANAAASGVGPVSREIGLLFYHKPPPISQTLCFLSNQLCAALQRQPQPPKGLPPSKLVQRILAMTRTTKLDKPEVAEIVELVRQTMVGAGGAESLYRLMSPFPAHSIPFSPFSIPFCYQAGEVTAQMDVRLILRDPFAQHFLCTQLLGVLLAEKTPAARVLQISGAGFYDTASVAHPVCSPLSFLATALSFVLLTSDAVAVVVANHKLPVNDELCKGLVEVRGLYCETSRAAHPCTYLLLLDLTPLPPPSPFQLLVVGEEADVVGRGDEEPKEAIEMVMSPLLHDVLPAFATLMADDEIAEAR